MPGERDGEPAGFLQEPETTGVADEPSREPIFRRGGRDVFAAGLSEGLCESSRLTKERHMKPGRSNKRASSGIASDDVLRFEAETAKRISGAKISAVTSFRFADNHQGQWPRSFAELKVEHPGSWLSDSSWEFVSGGNRASFANIGQTILFRERQSRKCNSNALRT